MTNLTRRETVAGAAALTMVGTAARAATHQVEINRSAFAPAHLNIAVGDTVVFTNRENIPHTATSSSFDTGRLNGRQSAEVTFSEAGSFAYTCRFHPRMKGTIQAG